MVRTEFTVRLEKVFQGPLDLLLHLVREQEVEIHEIEIARILEGYLAYLDQMQSLDIEVAGDFLVMAATLMSIKSRSLLPNEEVDLAEELDPRDELIQRLLEYRRFKGAADHLEASYNERASQVQRGYKEKPPAEEREFELGDLTVWDLLSQFSRLMRETLVDRPHHIVSDARPMRFFVDSVVHHLRATKASGLRGLLGAFEGVPPREALIGSFCAILELVRLELIELRQDGPDAEIQVQIRPEHDTDLEQVIDEAVLDEDELKHGGHYAEEEARKSLRSAHWAPDVDEDDAPEPLDDPEEGAEADATFENREDPGSDGSDASGLGSASDDSELDGAATLAHDSAPILDEDHRNHASNAPRGAPISE